ncbi:MAG TPA: glycoside hydrolase domain-containing protein [Planctomycetota bacterium]|nr:glycoside hydrolase domain-containing protein [Planctomycetota bacterium]
MPREARALFLLGLCAAGLAGQAAPEGDVVLTQRHYWRKHYTTFAPVFAGDGVPAPKPDSLVAMFPEPPGAGWSAPGFDDSGWLLAPGLEFEHGVKNLRLLGEMSQEEISARLRGTDPFLPAVGLVCLRSRFVVTDRAKVRKLTLALSCRGGFVAYLNGTEIARAHLPEGELRPGTPAEAYPPEAFFHRDSLEKGRPRALDPNDLRNPQWALRERVFGPAEIALDRLRDGVNVLAIEMHRGMYPPLCARQSAAMVGTVGLGRLELRAEADAGAISAPPFGVQVWTVDTTRTLFDPALSAANESRGPVRIVAARNGTFAGQALVAAHAPLTGLSAKASALRQAGGNGVIPAEAVSVRYGVPNPFWPAALRELGLPVTPPRWRRDAAAEGGTRFDMLLDAPPADASAVAVWVSARVPRDASAGRYTGELSIEAQGKAFTGTLELHVADWTLPDVKDYATLLNIYQSPDTLALYYKVKPWSDAHWKLIEKSLTLMGGMGNIGLFVPLLAESQMGNSESMVPWLKQADGSFRYDFSRFDRYTETALKTHDRLRFVSLNAWGYEASNRTWRGPRDYASFYGARVTVVEPATGKRESVKLPQYGTSECEALWRPLLVALHERLKAKGLGDSIVIGIAGDMGPDPPTAAMFRRILPEAGWLAESHQPQRAYVFDPQTKATVPVRWNSVVYGGDIPDPATRRLYGWQYDEKSVILNFNRSGSALMLMGYPPPWSFRMWMESTLVYGRAGNGRVGGDYWHIGAQLLGEGKAEWGIVGGSGGTLFNRYFHSHADETGLGRSCTDLFAPGPEGPATTIRLECAREGSQEAEARVFIEKALVRAHDTLPRELVHKCRALLDERTNLTRLWRMRVQDIAPFGWQERSRRLFDAAGEVSKVIASHKE